MTREMAVLLEELCSTGGINNPSMIAEMLARLKALQFTLVSACYYAAQVR
jgi:hypothetical protein